MGQDAFSTDDESRGTTGVVTSKHPLVHGMHSRVIGRVDLDHDRLQADIDTLLGFPFNRGYSDFARGNPGWQNCVLMNHSGDPSDIVFGGHGGPALPTPLLDRVPYLAELLGATFDARYLQWVRIFMCEDGMLIPHRDYLDLPEDEFTRVHIPLQLGDSSLHSEEGHVFRMRKGEVWFIDGTVDHAAYSYDGAPRIYLTADLVAGVPFDRLFADPSLAVHGVRPDFVDRPPLPDDFDVAIEGLAKVMGEDTIDDVIAVLSKVHFSHRAECGQMYDWLLEAAERSDRPALVEQARQRRSFFLGV